VVEVPAGGRGRLADGCVLVVRRFERDHIDDTGHRDHVGDGGGHDHDGDDVGDRAASTTTAALRATVVLAMRSPRDTPTVLAVSATTAMPTCSSAMAFWLVVPSPSWMRMPKNRVSSRVFWLMMQ
jgi:hypothetical protein